MIGLPSPQALILVCVVPSQRDLDIARLLGWYRIPFKTAPKVIDVDYLAFYQTGAAQKTEAGKINYVAAVRGHEMMTRAELIHDEPDHPHASEEYFKISIGPLVPLPVPIQAANWKRITFLYTTGDYLLKAHYLNELAVRDDERTTLWQSLRERGDGEGSAHVPDEGDWAMDRQTMEWLGMIFSQGYQTGKAGN